MNLHDFDLIIINSSGGKDSLVALYEIFKEATIQNYPIDKIKVSHQCLGFIEWPGTKELVQKQANVFGFECYYSKRKDSKGYEENLLEYVLRRGKWPSNKQRYCTSDFKRGPGQRIVTMLSKKFQTKNILQVFGFRADESPNRAKKEIFSINERLTNKSRKVFDYLPIHTMSTKTVWEIIKKNNLPYHYAYDLGMPRLSCVFCIFSPFDALVLAGKNNYELLLKYVEVEKQIEHDFRVDCSLQKVLEAVDSGYEPKKVSNWVM